MGAPAFNLAYGEKQAKKINPTFHPKMGYLGLKEVS